MLRVVALSLVILLGSGCRMYGGYGSEEAAKKTLETAVEQMEASLNQARVLSRDLEQLETPAAIVARVETIIEEHEALLAHYQSTVASLQSAWTYRPLDRTLGALVSDQHKLTTAYQKAVGSYAPRAIDPALWTIVPPAHYRN